MAKPRVLVLLAPGTNCDVETEFAFESAGAEVERVHVNRLVESPSQLEQFQILCLPGGFSFGDDVAAGRILATLIQTRLFEAVQSFRDHDKLILGICNGFQVLMKSGILLPEDNSGSVATLDWNDSGCFIDRWVATRVDGDRCVFLQGVESMYLPVAHAEGKFVTRDDAVFDSLQSSGQLALRYGASGQTPDEQATENPNGSRGHVAGVCDATGRIFGLMPHPERHLHPTNHPHWTRIKSLPAEGDGCVIFHNAVKYFR